MSSLPRPLRVGLTGGIASGKSLVGDRFAALGVPVLDADQVAREVVALGQPALIEIAEAFGHPFLLPDGTLDRRRMREHVFADPAARKRLETITHPRIRARVQGWLDAQTAPYSILSAAILVESGMRDYVHRVLVVDAPVDEQVRRLTRRDGISEALARQMLAAQADRERRLAAADDVILNEGPIEATRQAVERLHRQYLRLAEGN